MWHSSPTECVRYSYHVLVVAELASEVVALHRLFPAVPATLTMPPC